MKISKTILFSAAALLSGFCAVPAGATDVTNSVTVVAGKQLTEDYRVSSSGKLTINISETHTLSGSFLGSTSLSENGGNPEDLATDYADGAGYYDIRTAGGEIEITGGGTLMYEGFKDINYYNSTYSITNGLQHGEYETGFTDSLLGIGDDGNVDTNTTAFSGKLTVSGDTTFVVKGYLSQYVAYWKPRETVAHTSLDWPISSVGSYVGISTLVLRDTSTLSFASAGKNLAAKPLREGASETVRALNFLHNVKADVNTTIELGKSTESASRIVIETTGSEAGAAYGWDGESTIGKLSGTGRVYFTSAESVDADEVRGRVSITNRAEFQTLRGNASSAAVASLALNVSNEASVRNYVRSLSETYDLTGHKWSGEEGNLTLSTGVLADVFLTTNTILGTDSTHQNVVNNVLETATAVQLSLSYEEGDWLEGLQTKYYWQLGGAEWECVGKFLDTGMQTAETVEIYGTQVLNNLQSLFVERYTLQLEADEADGGTRGYSELTGFARNNNHYSTAPSYSSSVYVRSGGAIIINQLENRDGFFAGRFYTTDDPTIETSTRANDGYIIKVGTGTFANLNWKIEDETSLPDSVINRLFIYEGAWLSDVGSLGTQGARVYIGNDGILRIIANHTATLGARIEGAALSTLEITYNSSYTVKNEDGTETFHGGILSDGREFCFDSDGLYGRDIFVDDGATGAKFESNRGSVQILQSQDDFYGNVFLNDGMTLVLGNVGNNELDASFASAASISLEERSTIRVRSYQVLPTLSGGKTTSLVFDGDNYSSVGVLTGASRFEGYISGSGTLVKAGTENLKIATSNHSLATVTMSGTTTLGEDGALTYSSGVVLLNGSVILSDENQSFSALVGGENSKIEINGARTLTVGMDRERLDGLSAAIKSYYDDGGSRILYDAYYFATADASAYVGSGLKLEGIVGFDGTKTANLIAGLGAGRPDHMDENRHKDTFSVAHTIAYLKDPAKFANTFAHIYATIDEDTFTAMAASSAWQGSRVTVADSLKGTFDNLLALDTIRAFVASPHDGWTERELEDLLSFAETYDSSRGTALFVRDGTTQKFTLTRAGYRQLLDANVIKYMNLEGGVPKTFYDFISLFVDDYKLCFTTDNLAYLEKLYGLNADAIRSAETFEKKYAEFEKLIGLSYDAEEGELPSFAGTLAGSVSLDKIGSETLRLTGVNTYTGATIVEDGELRVDWDAVPNTSAIKVGSDGLLTLVSEEGAANVFKIAEGGVIYGSGVLLKDGEGTLVIDAALSKKVGSELDFTGEIVVGKGALVVNVDDRDSFSENVKVLLNKTTEFALNVKDKNHKLEFNGKIIGGADSLIETNDGETIRLKSYFTKDGAGTLVVTDGDALSSADNAFDVKVNAGTLQVNFKDNGRFRDGGAPEDFTATLGAGAKLVFDVAIGKDYRFDGLVENKTTTVETETGTEIVPVTGTTFEKTGAGTLTLGRQASAGTGKWTVNELKLSNGTLVLDTNSKYEFNKITTAADTTFVVNMNGTLVLDIASAESSEEKNVFGGTLSGNGNIEKTGEGELTLTASSFSGTLTLKKGSLVIDVEDGVERRLEFDLDVDAEDAAPTIKKTGAGSAEFTGSADLGGVKILVDAGTLKFDGGELVEDGVTSAVRTPSQIGIAEKATLEIAPATGMDLSGVALSGEGTFVFGSAQSSKTVKADADSIAAFTGTFSLGENVTLELAADVTSIRGIESGNPEAHTETVKFTTAAREIWVNPNRDVRFTGTLEAAAGTTLNVGGTGLLDVSGATLTNIGAIAVDSGANVGVSLNNALGVTLADGATLSLVGDVTDNSVYGGAVTIAENAEIEISFSGVRSYSGIGEKAVDVLGGLLNDISGAENVKMLTISNAKNADLKLTIEATDRARIVAADGPVSAPVEFAHDGVELATNAGGTLTLDTGAVAESGAIYRKTISGTGNFEKAGAGTLTLSAAEQTYTGKTTVSAGTLAFGAGTTLATSGIEVQSGATLAFGAGTILATSGITVNSGATLQGGATLNAESASVTFASGSKYKLNVSAGEALRYKGAVSITGTLDLEIAQDQTLRGEALSIFEYVGRGRPSAISPDWFSLGEGSDMLYVDRNELGNGNLKVYVAQRDFRDVPADYHDGLDSLLDILSVWARPEGGYLSDALSTEEYAIADALNKTSLGDLGDEITKLSSLGFASMVTMPHAGFSADARSLSGRLEQRLYDASSAIWVYAQDVEFFAQAQGSTVDNGSGSDAATFDYDTYGALVGADVKFNKDVTAGVALAYDRGKATLHDGGGKIDSDNVRATAFAGFLLNDYLALNVGAQVGYAKFDTKRNTLVGTNKGDTDAWHGGVFADLVGAYALATWGETSRLDLLPHAGIAFSYYRTDKFEEKGSGSALATDSFNAFSLEASVGAKLNYVFEIDGHGTRVGLDFSLIHEFLDDEVEIDSWISDSKFSTDARALSETTFSLAPSVSFDLTDKASVFLNYELRLGTESEVAHRANLGFRYRY